MNSTIVTDAPTTSPTEITGSTNPRWIDKVAKKLVHKTLDQLQSCRVTIYDHGCVSRHGCDAPNLEATVSIVDPTVWSELAFGGSVTAGEAYIENRWECDDLTALMRIFARERSVLAGLDSGFVGVKNVIRSLAYRFQRNTRTGSRKNIAAHYDLSNDFFSHILDQQMQYSSAIFPSPSSTLEQAQRQKLAVIAQRLDLRPGMSVLEIGTGWGGLAAYLAAEHDISITTITISQAQYDVAVQRVRDAGLEERVKVQLSDYRDIDGQYDRIVSIEMIEAVGHEYYQTFFDTAAKLLKPDGLFLMQAITLPQREYSRARREVDFIKKYIFPGCCIPSIARLSDCADRSGFDVAGQHDFSIDYARTLACWDKNMEDQWEHIAQLGFDQQFFRMWRFYFRYCEGGFAERAINVSHLLFARVGYRPAAYERLGYGSEVLSVDQVDSGGGVSCGEHVTSGSERDMSDNTETHKRQPVMAGAR